jgi:hypothetical protein
LRNFVITVVSIEAQGFGGLQLVVILQKNLYFCVMMTPVAELWEYLERFTSIPVNKVDHRKLVKSVLVKRFDCLVDILPALKGGDS